MDDLRILESSPWAVVHDDVYYEVFDRLVGIWNRSLNPNFDPPSNYFWDYREWLRELYHHYFGDDSSRFNLEDMRGVQIPKLYEFGHFYNWPRRYWFPRLGMNGAHGWSTRQECSSRECILGAQNLFLCWEMQNFENTKFYLFDHFSMGFLRGPYNELRALRDFWILNGMMI